MLILLTILFPILSGIILWYRNTRTGRDGHALYIACILITDVLAVLSMLFSGPVTMIRLSPGLNLSFELDMIGRCFLTVALILYTCILFYSFIYMKVKEREPSFLAFYFVSLGALVAVCSASNMITIYLAFEVTTLSTVPLVMHDRTKTAVSAGMKFLFYSMGGALLGLIGVLFLYTYTSGSVLFTPGGVLDAAKVQGHEQIMYLASFLAVLGYGAKAGMFPMHSWLPSAHPVAPAPASALLSGIITKTGVLVIIRFIYYSIGIRFLRGSWMQYAWIALAMLTVLMGSLMAFQEKIFKRRLAYSSVSQLSYALIGLALLQDDGLKASLLQVLQHAPMKACLFLCAGAFIYRYGLHDVRELKGIGRRMPIVLWALTIAAMSLVGIPPMGGFVSKWNLVSACLGSETGVFTVLIPVVFLISALLTAGYLFPITIDGFFPGRDADPVQDGADAGQQADAQTAGGRRLEAVPAMMWVPLLILCAVSLFVGLYGNRLAELFEAMM